LAEFTHLTAAAATKATKATSHDRRQTRRGEASGTTPHASRFSTFSAIESLARERSDGHCANE
jgi:hypothetical protein